MLPDKWPIILFCVFSSIYASKFSIDESGKFILYESSTIALDSDVQIVDDETSVDLNSFFTPYLPKSLRDLLSISDLVDRSKVLIDESKQRMFDFYHESCPQNADSNGDDKKGSIITVGSFQETEEQKKDFSLLTDEFMKLESKLDQTHVIHEKLAILEKIKDKRNFTEQLLANEIKLLELNTKKILEKLLKGHLIESSEIREHSNRSKIYNQSSIVYLGSKLTRFTCAPQTLDGVLITKSVHQEHLHVGNGSSTYAEFVGKNQFVKYELPDVELVMNDTILGITIQLCNLELFEVYTCGKEAIKHDCNHKTPTNCKKTSRNIGAGFTFVQQIGTYTNVYSNEKNYSYVGSDESMPEDGHLIIQVNSTHVFSIGNTTVVGHGNSVEVISEFMGVDCSGQLHEMLVETMTVIVIIFVSLTVLICALIFGFWMYKRIQRKSVQGNL